MIHWSVTVSSIFAWQILAFGMLYSGVWQIFSFLDLVTSVFVEWFSAKDFKVLATVFS